MLGEEDRGVLEEPVYYVDDAFGRLLEAIEGISRTEHSEDEASIVTTLNGILD